MLLEQKKVADEIIIVVRSTKERKNYDFNNPSVAILHQNGVGPSNARNFGAKHASSDVLVFLDSDCYPSNERWMAALLANFVSSRTRIVSGRIIVPKGSATLRFVRAMNGLGTPDNGTKGFEKDQFWSFPATNFAIRKTCFNLLLGFDESLLIAEDVDFCIKTHKRGISIKYSPEAVVYHFHRKKLGGLLKHGWETGKGSLNFIRKYGFWNKFLKRTSISVFTASLFLLTLLFLFTSLMMGIPGGLLILSFLVISYFTLVIKFWRPKESILDPLMFPLILALYSVSSGLGTMYQYLSTWGRRR